MDLVVTEVGQSRDVLARQHVNLLLEQFRDGGDTVLYVRIEFLLFDICKRVGLHDANTDAAQTKNIGDILHRTPAYGGKHPQFRTIIED